MADFVYTSFLDAGHGGSDPDAVYNGRQEKDGTLSLTLAVGEILESYGFRVIYSRTEDIYESPYQKAAKANASGANIFISIHRNSSPYPNQYSGVETPATGSEPPEYFDFLFIYLYSLYGFPCCCLLFLP